jgi:small subunit ribosomal protein S4
LVSHRHITINGRIVNIPSYSLQRDVVAVREKSKSLQAIDNISFYAAMFYRIVNLERRYTKTGTFVKNTERVKFRKHQRNINQ